MPQHFDSGIEPSVTTNLKDLPYYLFVPDGYDPSVKYPLVVMLHGAGEVNEKAVTGNPMKPVLSTFLSPEYRAKNPCFLLAPQLVDDVNGNMPSWYSYRVELNNLLTKITTDYNIDPARWYITGMSWGGFGTAAFLANWPDKWAAGAPLCGNASSRPNVKTPVWFFHASNDGTVDSRGSEENVYNMRAQRGNPIFSRFTTGGHDSWTPAYSNVRFWDWLLSQRLHVPGAGAIPQSSSQHPVTRILTAQVGSTLSLSGIADPGSDMTVTELAWFSDRIPVTTGTGSTSGSTPNRFFSSNNSFTAADVGKRLLISDDRTDSWNGYKVTVFHSPSEIQVDKSIVTGANVLTNRAYRLAPEGSSHFPKTFAANKQWQVTGIPLSTGSNTIGIVARTVSYKTGDGGNTWFGHGKITVNYAAPVSDTTPPTLLVDQAVAGVHLIETQASVITLSGTAGDAGGSVAVTWATDFNIQGTATMDGGAWTASNIPLSNGYNRVTITASDPSGNRSISVLEVQRNIPPVAAPDAYHVYAEGGGVLPVLENDSDPDGSPQILWISSFEQPSHGTLTRYGRALHYKPSPGYQGFDSFTYVVSDGFHTSQAEVDVTVVGRPTVYRDVIVEQDFESSTSVASYSQLAAPTSGQFNDLSAEPNSGGVSIEEGKLRFVHSGSTGSTNGAGFTRLTGMTGRKLVEVAFDIYVVNPVPATATQTVCTFQIGNYTSVTDYNSTPNQANTVQTIVFTSRNTQMGLRAGGSTAYWTDLAFGTPYRVLWVVNGDSVAREYPGPDGVLHTLDPKSGTIFVNDNLIQGNLPQTGYSGSVINGLRMAYAGTLGGVVFTIDNVRIAEVREHPVYSVGWIRAQANLAEDGSEDAADTAGDGVPDLLKYAFNMVADPGDILVPNVTTVDGNGVSGLPAFTLDPEGNFTIRYVRLKSHAAVGLSYSVLQSGDLSEWNPGVGTSSVTSLDADWERVDWTYTGDDWDKVFFRVGVDGAP
jgi:predicted esterase